MSDDRTDLLRHSAFQNNPLMLSVADLANDCYLEVNDTFCRCLRVTREEVVGHSAVELGMITPEGRDRLARELMAMLSATEKYPLEFELRVRGGATILCRYWGQIIQGPQGPLLFAAAEDITGYRDQERAREAALRLQAEALRRSDERFALAMDAFSDGLWDWDLASDASYFSPGCYRMLGYALGGLEVTGLGWLSVVHHDERAALEQAIRACADGERDHFEGEYRLETKNGEWHWVLVRGRCVERDEQGRGRRLIGTLVDVSERKRLQLGLAQNDRLASLGMLSAGVAHEINNPLAYVTSSLELIIEELRRAPLTSEASRADLLELSRNALEGSLRVRKIARTLSSFSRVEPAEQGHLDLNAALQNAAKMANAEVRYRGTLTTELGELPPVLGSEGKLTQVFLNLIVNATHALDEQRQAHNHIRLRTWCEGRKVFAEVADNGVGISPDHLERVFEPFFTTKRAGVGSGLGLAISKRIVNDLGGEIRIESTPGEGTRVTVVLPAVEARAQPAPPPSAPRPQHGPRGRLLLIDDEALLRGALARRLSPHHEVVTAASAIDAQALLQGGARFDAVLCDLMMPRLSGMDFHAWLTLFDPALADRVIFLSGGAFTPNAAEYLARVKNRRLEKPIDVARLLGAIADALRAG